jgi:hypothetical protein
MIIKCTYANGDEVITRFNGTFEEAQIYYLNKLFNLGTTSDNMQKCIKVEEYCEGHTGCKCSGCQELLKRMN